MNPAPGVAVDVSLAFVAGERRDALEPGAFDEDGIVVRVAALAVGWATVELERWGGTELVGDDGLLGARVAVAPPGPALPGSPLPGSTLPWRASSIPVVLVEPSTEGRLAAFLARHGEGPAVLYVAGSAGAGSTRVAGPISGAPRRPATQSPFGPAHLLVDSRHGPFLALCAGPFDALRSAYHRAMIDRQLVTLRPATAADATRIAALLGDEGYPAGASDIVARLERFATDRSHVIVGERDGEVLGFVALHVIARFELDDPIVRVIALVVDPDVRERGVGHQLMEEAERIGREAGAAYVEVTAGHRRPDALRLYEALEYDATVATYLRKRL